MLQLHQISYRVCPVQYGSSTKKSDVRSLGDEVLLVQSLILGSWEDDATIPSRGVARAAEFLKRL
jgi:hypothetical protein